MVDAAHGLGCGVGRRSQSDPAAATASLLFPAASFPQLGDVVADFSSRGPVANSGQYLVKPDITAPGVDILAAYAANFGGGATATALDNGTSMSSPHIAGSAGTAARAAADLDAERDPLGDQPDREASRPHRGRRQRRSTRSISARGASI